MVFTAAAVPLAPARAADLFLNDEPEIYAAIDKLNAAGYLPGLLANTRPYSMQAVRAAAEAASQASVPEGFDGELLRWLLSYSVPTTMGRVTAAVSHSDARFIPPNNEGLPRPKGWSAQGSIAAREETTPYLSAQLRAASFRGEGRDDEGNRLLDTSIEAGYKYASIQAGKLSTWYGPGRNGALIFTNNAAPYPGVRIRNPEPIPLTGWFKFLGNVQYDIFAARMEKTPGFSHHTLVGMRVAARPAGWLEIGLSRALHYGGDGRSNGLSEFATSFSGNNDPAGRSNTLAGYDITVTLPFPFQPVQAYWDRAGEGDNRFLGTGLPWPSQWGNILGLYFPKLLGSSRLDLRAEYADNYSGYGKTASWYSHGAYPHRYRGDVLGHPMGGGSRDWFVGSRYYFLPSTFAEVSYEKILHDKGVQPSIGFPGERRSRISAGFTGWLNHSWRAEAHSTIDRVTNEGGVPGSTGTDFSAFVAVSYQTYTFSGTAREN
ncbi:MAG: hypothetical protein HZA60_00300 [Deltaproteobacteria bacterium]|nr:hypothetical protein [Deltaproteobacteria bacterium]